MKKNIRQILILTLIILYYSCQDNEYENIETLPKLKKTSEKVSLSKNDSEKLKNIFLPTSKLLNGQILVIDHEIRGCFGSTHEKIKIKKVNEIYFLTFSRVMYDEEIQIFSDSAMDTSFVETLNEFTRFCKSNIIEGQKEDRNSNLIYSTLYEGISINDGLHSYNISFPQKSIGKPFSLISTFTKQLVFQ